MISPCVECLCKPLCKNKHYTNLMRCKLVYDFVYARSYTNIDSYSRRMVSMFESLGVEKIRHLGYYIHKIDYEIDNEM